MKTSLEKDIIVRGGIKIRGNKEEEENQRRRKKNRKMSNSEHFLGRTCKIQRIEEDIYMKILYPKNSESEALSE